MNSILVIVVIVIVVYFFGFLWEIIFFGIFLGIIFCVLLVLRDDILR